MAANNTPPDGLMHELIETVRDNTEKTIAVRNDVNRAMSIVYQDIVVIKQQLAAEAKERPARQTILDQSIGKINKRLDSQDGILEGQDRKLDHLFNLGRRRFWLMVAILVVCLFVGARVALVWLGWIA